MSLLTLRLLAVMLGLMSACTLAGWILRRAVQAEAPRALVEMFNARVRAWWKMTLVLAAAMAAGPTGSLVVFGLTSFLLLREFITIAPTRRGDHHALFWVFLAIPLQYWLLAADWYGLFAILIPVYVFLLVPARMALSGDARGYLERAAKIQWSLMLCVYCVAHAPALLRLDFAGEPEMGLRLLLFLAMVTQATDVVQGLGDGLFGRRKLMPAIEPRLSVEGLAAAVVAATGLGTALWWATPFSPLAAAGMSLVVALMAAAGGMCLTAIKKDRGRPGVVVVETRPRVMDRTIPLCFAAPVFFHLTRYFFIAGPLARF